jgi:hypothetical protein
MTIETPPAVTPLADDSGLREHLRISRTTSWRFRQAGMPFIRVGRGIRYDIAEVLEWINKNGSSVAPDSTANIVGA